MGNGLFWLTYSTQTQKYVMSFPSPLSPSRDGCRTLHMLLAAFERRAQRCMDKSEGRHSYKTQLEAQGKFARNCGAGGIWNVCRNWVAERERVRLVTHNIAQLPVGGMSNMQCKKTSDLRLNGFLGLSLNDGTILFLFIILDMRVSDA